MTATLTHSSLSRKTLLAPDPPVVQDEALQIVTAPVACTANLDDVNDIIAPGGFADTLKARRPKGVWSHDWQIMTSKTLDIAELMPGDPRLPEKILTAGAGALMVTMQFAPTTAGRDAFETVKFYADECCWSIGYIVPSGGATVDKASGVRTIHKLDVFEYSVVLFGANALAEGAFDVKTRGGRVQALTEKDVRRWRAVKKAARTVSGNELERWRRVRAASKPLSASELRRLGRLKAATDRLDDFASQFPIHAFCPPYGGEDDDEAPCLSCGLSQSTGNHLPDPDDDAPKRARMTRRNKR